MKTALKHDKTVIADTKDAVASYGILTDWDDERGYGFITPEDGSQKVFLHVKSLQPSARRPMRGEMFFYKLTTDDKGRPRAEEAFQRDMDERQRLPFHHSVIKGLSYFWLLGVIPFVVMTIKTSLKYGLCLAFVVNSLLTILFYWEDKHLAQYKYWRIPEKSLHIWELLCGWPGALYAQQAFRHKRSKTSFMIVFWLCAAANILVCFLLFKYAKF